MSISSAPSNVITAPYAMSSAVDEDPVIAVPVGVVVVVVEPDGGTVVVVVVVEPDGGTVVVVVEPDGGTVVVVVEPDGGTVVVVVVVGVMLSWHVTTPVKFHSVVASTGNSYPAAGRATTVTS